MDIQDFDIRRDLDYYLEGGKVAFQESFPGVVITSDLERDMRTGIAGINGNEDMAGFTALQDNVPIGSILVCLQWFYNIPQGYIDSIYVKEEYRKSGVAKELLAAAEKWALRKGARSVCLDVSNTNRNAVTAYEKLGFVATLTQMERVIES
ncbi:GNAT family N-acetyltransferase [Hahella ganghwensis]|uniref:GNAT family N-acetyltransferase n=1 Tax=Hahella ganghwensis TaxID=286420 RepID=UPI00036BABD9|nr:GNAT family N-acetyltransferase [Hahella ganghwensis]